MELSHTTTALANHLFQVLSTPNHFLLHVHTMACDSLEALPYNDFTTGLFLICVFY